MKPLRILLPFVVVIMGFDAASAPNRLIERAATDRDVQVLLQSRSVNCDPQGTCWVYHGITGIEREPQAAGVTAIRPDGTTRTYLASDLLPRGSVMPGMVGQVYAVASLSSAGRYVATAGWIAPDHSTRSAIVFFTETDGRIEHYSSIPAPGARAVAAGPANTAVVAVPDPLKNGDYELVTIIDAAGNVLGTYGSFEANEFSDGHARIAGVRLQQMGPSTVAVLDQATNRLHGLRIYMPADCAIPEVSRDEKPRRVVKGEGRSRVAIEELWTRSIGDPGIGATELHDVLGFHAAESGRVTVVRPAVVENQPRTIITRYSEDGRAESVTAQYWRAALVGKEIVGVIQAESVWEERVDF